MKHLIIGVVLIGIGWFAAAPRNAWAQDDANVSQLIRESQTALAEAKFADAERLSKNAIDLDPAYPQAWRQYGLALLRGGKILESVAPLQRAVEMDESDATAWRALAQACWQSEKQNEAVRALSAYLRLKPDDAAVWRDLAAWLTRLERAEQAIAALERVVGLKPDDASAWRELAAWQSRLKRSDQAVIALEQVARLKPQDATAWRELANELSRMARFEQAASALERVITLKPDDVTAWRELANVLTRLERTETAIAAFENLLKLKPDDAAAWRAVAVLRQRAGNLAEAAKAFEQALAHRPDDPATRRDLGWILWTLGRRDEATKLLSEAIESGIEARERVIYQVVARLSEEGADAEALAFLRRVTPNTPPSALGLELARSGRLKAADPVLTSAWNTGDRTADVGLYLAYVRAVNGQFTDIPQYLEPLLGSISEISPERADLALEALRLGGNRPETPDLVARLEAVLQKTERTIVRVTEILEMAAEAHRVNGKPAQALSLYRRVLERSPDRPSWIWAVLLAEHVEGQMPEAWLERYEKQVTSPAIRAGIKGLRADRRDQAEEAIAALRDSLTLEPNQAMLRQVLFQRLLREGRVAEARAEADWFAEHVEQGESMLRSHLAEMLTRLGETQEALTHWQLLHISYPENLNYGIETAFALYQLDRSDEAMEILLTMTESKPEARVYELIAEIASARAHTATAIDWAARGLAAAPSPALLRYHAENLELLETNAPAALASAQAFLQQDTGYVPLSLLAGRMLAAIGATNAVDHYYQQQLARNPVFLPALVALRDTATREGRIDDAVGYARTRADLQPDNAEASRQYANSLAQQDRFRSALRILRPLARAPLEKAVPVLVYRSIALPPYAGRNSVSQISRHIKRLADDGFAFINAFSQIPETPNARRVMIILIDPEPGVIEALDPVLQHYNARVVYAGNATVPTLCLSGQPIPERLSPVLASDRWQLASGGPADLRRQPVNEAGVLGNPLTQPVMLDGKRESASAFSKRIDRQLADASRALKQKSERILVYPSGDFGQRSLDSTPDNLKILRGEVADHFTHAVYFDDSGFYLTESKADPLRIPARTVPPTWDEQALSTYLATGHPLTRARLELARVLYWNGQHEAAHAAFAHAAAAGADARELVFNWGMNSDRQGDIHTAREKLRVAQALDPEAERVARALERTDDRRRPQAEVYIQGWQDNEDRSHFRIGATGEAFLNERVRLGGTADRNRWETDGNGHESGTRLGLIGQAYLAPQVWLSGRLWRLGMDDLDHHWGGAAALRLPNPLLSGYLALTASREEIETVEALRANIDANTYGLRTYTRLIEVLDLFADLSHIQRSDGNDTAMLEGRLLYRFKEWPYVGAGWRFRFADSDRNPPEYWAPEELEQHQLHVNLRGTWSRLSGTVSADAGYARQRDTDWRFVWGARGSAELFLTKRFSLNGELGWFEGPDYERLHGRIGLTGRF